MVAVSAWVVWVAIVALIILKPKYDPAVRLQEWLEKRRAKH